MKKLSILSLLFLSACGLFKKKSDTVPAPNNNIEQWMQKMVIYEVNLRHHTPEGTINAFIPKLDELKKLGINMLWIMPVQPIGLKKRKAKGDVFIEDIKDANERKKYLGSPYSIQDYKAINPDLGNMEDFKTLVNEAHKKGFKIILDWVGNHTAWDNALITEHPDWYLKNKKGEITDPLNEKGESMGWTDVAELDYDNTDLRNYMASTMRYWIDNTGLDGFRCDVAMNVPADFWTFAKKEIEKSKPVFMLAESEEHDMKQFDYCFNSFYGWEMHHYMNQICKGNKTAKTLDTLLTRKLLKFKPNVFAMNFITNHDENSWNGTEFDRMGQGWRAMAVFAFTANGIPLMYTGQEVGLKHKMRFFEKDTVVGSKDYDYYKFYQNLLKVKLENDAFDATAANNNITFIPTSNPNLLVYERGSNDNRNRVIINMSNTKISSENTVLKNAKILFSEGLDKTQIGAWGYAILKL